VNLPKAANFMPYSKLIDGKHNGDSVQLAEQQQALVTRILLALRSGSTPKVQVPRDHDSYVSKKGDYVYSIPSTKSTLEERSIQA
jgi:hypothetical protein